MFPSHAQLRIDLRFCREYITQYQETSSVLQKLYGAMADNGVLVASLGFAHAMDPVASDMEMTRGFLDALVTAGFASVRDYEEVRCESSLVSLGYSLVSNTYCISSLLGTSWV